MIKRNKILLGIGGLILLSIMVFCVYQTTAERDIGISTLCKTNEGDIISCGQSANDLFRSLAIFQVEGGTPSPDNIAEVQFNIQIKNTGNVPLTATLIELNYGGASYKNLLGDVIPSGDISIAVDEVKVFSVWVDVSNLEGSYMTYAVVELIPQSGDVFERSASLGWSVSQLDAPSVTTTTIPTVCSIDSDCGWCGANCVVSYPGMVCTQMMPPDGYDCKCVASKCSSVPTPTTTTQPPYVPPVCVCSDSDGGISYFIKGSTLGGDRGDGICWDATDYCQGVLLHEYYCDGKYGKHIQYYCNYGCSDGACLEGTPDAEVDVDTGGDALATCVLEQCSDYSVLIACYDAYLAGTFTQFASCLGKCGQNPECARHL